METRRAAIRSLRGSDVCSGWRTMANSQLVGSELSSSEQLADEHELEEEDEHEDDDEDEEEQDDPLLLASLLPLLLLRALGWWCVVHMRSWEQRGEGAVVPVPGRPL